MGVWGVGGCRGWGVQIGKHISLSGLSQFLSFVGLLKFALWRLPSTRKLPNNLIHNTKQYFSSTSCHLLRRLYSNYHLKAYQEDRLESNL